MKPWALRRSREYEHRGLMGETAPGGREAGQGTPAGLSRRLNWVAAAAGFNRKSCVQQMHGLLSLTLHQTSLCIYRTSLYTGHHSVSTGHHSASTGHHSDSTGHHSASIRHHSTSTGHHSASTGHHSASTRHLSHVLRALYGDPLKTPSHYRV